MSKLAFMTAYGHRGTESPSELENIVAAGHGFYAHAGNVDHAGHEVIDQAQLVTSDVLQDAAEIPAIVALHTPHVQQSVSHTWQTSQMRIVAPLAVHIPEALGWL